MSHDPLLSPESPSQGVSCSTGGPTGCYTMGVLSPSPPHPGAAVEPSCSGERTPPREMGSSVSLEVCAALSEEQANWIMIISPLAPAISRFKHLSFLAVTGGGGGQGCPC